MKVSATNSIKFRRLERRTGWPRWKCIGVLESLWHCCLANTPDGAIGKLSDEDIALAMDWDETSPEELVAVLVECGWLDECHNQRLVVHDWGEHAPSYLKGNMGRQKQSFAVASTSSAGDDAPQVTLKNHSLISDAPKESHPATLINHRSTYDQSTYPILSNPSLSNPPPPPPVSKPDAAAPPEEGEEERWEGIEAAIRGDGVAQWQSAVQTARQRGVSADEAALGVSLWRKWRDAGRCNGGAIVQWLQAGVWPPGCESRPPPPRYVDKQLQREQRRAALFRELGPKYPDRDSLEDAVEAALEAEA